jgi:hypothetical protein
LTPNQLREFDHGLAQAFERLISHMVLPKSRIAVVGFGWVVGELLPKCRAASPFARIFRPAAWLPQKPIAIGWDDDEDKRTVAR